MNKSEQGDGANVLPKPVPNGIARLNQATGRRGAAQTVQHGSSMRGRRVLRKPLRAQQTLAQIPMQEDATQGPERVQTRSNSKGKQRAVERGDPSLRARALQTYMAEKKRLEQTQHNSNVGPSRPANGKRQVACVIRQILTQQSR